MRGDWIGCSGIARNHQGSATETPASLSTVKPVSYRHGPRGWRPRMKPLCKNRHLQTQLKYTAVHEDKPIAFWRKVLRSDKTKTELFVHRDRRYVWRRKGEAYEGELPPNFLASPPVNRNTTASWTGCSNRRKIDHSWFWITQANIVSLPVALT